MDKEQKMEIARTILSQLGGHKFVVMTGAKDIYALDNGLQFKLPGGGGFCKQGINKVSIELTPMDTYKVSFLRVWAAKWKMIAEYSDIYCDQLRGLFEKETGLRTSL